MDELVIGGRQYISSRRAAQITGYAKDYIGQMCRSGRVEGKLVGRNWYIDPRSLMEATNRKRETVHEDSVLGSPQAMTATHTSRIEPDQLDAEVLFEDDPRPLVPDTGLLKREYKSEEDGAIIPIHNISQKTKDAVVDEPTLEPEVHADTEISSHNNTSVLTEESTLGDSNEGESSTERITPEKVRVEPSRNAVDLRVFGLISGVRARRVEPVATHNYQGSARETAHLSPASVPARGRGRFNFNVGIVGAVFGVTGLLIFLGDIVDGGFLYPTGQRTYSMNYPAIESAAFLALKNLVKTRNN